MPVKKKTSSKKKTSAAQRRLNFDTADAPSRSAETQAAASRDGKRDHGTAVTTAVAGSPVKRTKISSAAAAVTPEEDTASNATRSYVPQYIHANVAYRTKGNSALSETTRKVYQWIVKHHEIPNDLEQRRSYGPLSGSSYEERVIQQYDLGQLKRTTVPTGDDLVVSSICTSCAEVGHKRNDCPALI